MQEKKIEEGASIIAPSSNYLVLNIIAIVLGFFTQGLFAIPLVIGIIGLVFSIQVDSNIRRSDLSTARNNARVAKILGIVSITISSLFLLVVGLFLGLLIFSYTR